jgi:hypothetical protein
MMGLEMYEGGLGAFMDAQGLKESLMAGAVGAGGILLTATVVGKWTQPAAGSGSMFAPDAPGGGGTMMFKRAKAGLAALIGVLGGRAIHDKNRDASMAFTGAVAGMGIADLVASFVNDPASTTGPTVRASLAGGYLSGADLRALEAAVATPMAAWRPSYEMSGFGSGPVVRTSPLSAPVTSVTELGAYAPYLA